MVKLRTESINVSGKETSLSFDERSGTLRIEKLAPHLKDLDTVLGFACIDENGNKYRLGYEPAKGVDRGGPGKYYIYGPDGLKSRIEKIDLTSRGCPKNQLSFKRQADVTVEIKQGTELTIRCGMKLDLQVRAADGHGLGAVRGLTFDDNPDPYLPREEMKFNTKELMDKIAEITAEGYTAGMKSGKEDVNIGPFEVLSGKGIHSFITFEKENGEKRSLFIDNKMVRTLSLSKARRNEAHEMKKAEKFTALYKALEPACRNRRERELLQRHIFMGDDLMGVPISEAVLDASEVRRRMDVYHDSTSMVLSFTKNLGTLTDKEKRVFEKGEGSVLDFSEALRKVSEMTVRPDGHNGTDGYIFAADGTKGNEITLHDDGFEHTKGTLKESYEAQRRELIAKFSRSFADAVEKDTFKDLAKYCRENKLDLLESARVTENEPLLWEKAMEQDSPELFMDLIGSAHLLKKDREVPPEVAMSVLSMMKEGRLELDAPSYRKTNVQNALKRGSLFFEIMSTPETNLTAPEVTELMEAYLEGNADLTAADIHKLASAEGVRRVDAIKDYLLTGDEKLLKGNVAYKGRYVQEMMERFIEKASGDGVKRYSQDPENAGFTLEVISDPVELINEFNNTNRMGCRVTSLGDGIMSYTVPVVGGLYAESYEEVGPEFTKLHELSNISYTLDKSILEEYAKDNGYTLGGEDFVEDYEEPSEEEYDEEYDSYEVYSLG